jgi:SAM-dependent methyltransferase
MDAGPLPRADEADASRKNGMPPCRCCGSQATEFLYSVPAIPVHSCVLLSTAEAARSFPRRDLELAFCRDCGFAFNHKFDEDVIGYSTDFEESQHFSGTFNAFAKSLAGAIAERCSVRGKRVLEIGCGKGEFLIELCEVGGASGIGIDPGYRADAGRRPTDARVEFIVDAFAPGYQELECDLVLCRHTLEHIPHVADFIESIRNIRNAGEDTWVVFETPDFGRVLEEGAFWDIYYEHCSYFSAGTHARLFRKHGFDVRDLELVYDGQYIVQFAKPAHSPTCPCLPLEHDLEHLTRCAEAFPERARAQRERWLGCIADAYAAGRRIVLWGGGSKAVSFLTTLGLDEEIDAAVDINPYKQGRFTPGTGHPVIAPKDLVSRPPDLVIVMNPIYRDEVKTTLSDLALFPDIVTV